MPRKGSSRPNKITSPTEALRTVAQGLRTASVRPNIHGYSPHDKQIRFHASQASIRGLFGGNRSGKTVSGGTEAVMRATGRHLFQHVPPPPTYGRVCAVDFKDGVEKVVKPEIARWIPPSDLINSSWEDSYNKELKTLTLENGSTIEFMSYEQETEKFAGTSRHWIWFDEEPPRDVYVECAMRLLDTRGCCWFTMTPLNGMNWIYDDVWLAAQTDPRIEVWSVDITDNPYLNQVEIELVLAGLKPHEREARAHGKFVEIGGLIYGPEVFSTKNILKPFLPPKEWMHVAGMDHGLANPTAWLWAAIDPLGRIVVYDEYYQSGKIVAYHAGRVHEINQNHDRIPDYYIGDPSIRNRDPLREASSVQIEYINHGIPIIPGNNDVKAGIDLVTNKFVGAGDPPNNVPYLYFTANCVEAIREHSRYRWDKWASRRANEEKNKKEEPVKKDDHTCDALRYLVASRPQQDTGTSIPENKLWEGSSEPVDAYSRSTDTRPLSHNGDYHMGEDW